MSQRSLRLACLAAVFGCAAYPGVSLGQGGEEATAPGEGEGPAAGAGPEDTQDAGATPRPAADPPTRTAPLVVAGPGEEQSPPAVAKGQAGQELHDAHYRVKKETDVLTVRRKRKTGVKPPDDLRAGLSLAAGSVAKRPRSTGRASPAIAAAGSSDGLVSTKGRLSPVVSGMLKGRRRWVCARAAAGM